MLVVTAYYDIPSKQSKENYYQYIRLFFKYITVPTVLFFTDNKNYQELKDIAGKNVIFHILEFEDLDVFQRFPPSFWQEQIKIDPEKYHTWQLGAIWANKARFVKKAKDLINNYDWYMWVDAGCVRHESWEPVLKDFGSRSYHLSPGVFIQSLNRNIPDEKFFRFNYGTQYIAGSHMMFHKDYIEEFITKYDEIVNSYVEEKVPVIMDQYIVTSMSLKYDFIKRIELMSGSVIDRWFFFFYLF